MHSNDINIYFKIKQLSFYPVKKKPLEYVAHETPACHFKKINRVIVVGTSNNAAVAYHQIYQLW
jgi:hypothetical protein